MRAVITLPSLQSYVDRFKLVCTLSGHLDHVTLLTNDCSPELMSLALQFPNLTVVDLGAGRFTRRATHWLEAEVERASFDIVHDTFGFLAPFFQRHGPNPCRRFRLLTTMYTSNWDWFRDVRRVDFDISWTYAKQRISTLWRERRICSMADRVMVLGPGHEQTIHDAHGLPIDRVAWCPAEVDIDYFCPEAEMVPKPPILTFSGAVCRNKGVDVLMHAASALKESGEDFTLKLVGRVLFWERQWFAQSRRSHTLQDHLIHFGHRTPEDLLRHYRQSSFFVFPSRFEGSPRCVREALACGLPCIVSDIPGHRGLDPDGRFLHFVEGWAPHDWATAIKRALAEPEKKWRARSRAGRRHMEVYHSFAAVAYQWAALYDSLCTSPPWPCGGSRRVPSDTSAV